MKSNTKSPGALVGLVLAGVIGASGVVGGCGSDKDTATSGSSGGITKGDGGTSSSGASGTSGSLGGTSSSGASGGTSGSSGSSGDGGSSSGNDVACNTQTSQVVKLPIDMMLGLDTSLSMDFDDKWINVRDAITLFVGNPKYSDLGVGVQFFPIRKQCSVQAYETPAVPLQLQAQAAAPIIAALDAQEMAGGTPMVQVLEGLTAYLTANATANRKPVLVLATDGFPDDNCLDTDDGQLANTFENAIAVAKAAYEGNPSIPTFVIGVGTELAALDDIAAAGGTTSATLVDTGSGDTQAAFVTALDNIRKRAIPCDYAVPTSGVDVNATNVSYVPGTGGPAEQFVFVGTDTGCSKAPSNGWYFDNEAAPTKVILCDATCDVVKEDDQGQVSLVFGCPRVDVK